MATLKQKVTQYRTKVVKERVVSYASGPVDGPHAAAGILHAMLDDRATEHMAVVYLGADGVPVGCEIVAIGGVSSCEVVLANVFRGAILARANGIILGHNHPSGDSTPSAEDIAMTVQVSQASKVLGIALLDHIIVCRDGSHASMHEKGLCR